MRRALLSEKNLVVVLFVTVFIIFSLARQDTKKIEKMYVDPAFSSVSSVPQKHLSTVEVKDIAPSTPLQ